MRKRIIGKQYEGFQLDWDTEYFGIPAARVNLNGIVDSEGQREISDFCKEFQFVTLWNFNNINENNIWLGENTNAFLADVNIQFCIDTAPEYASCDQEIRVNNHFLPDTQIVKIAREAFRYSRFFNDRKLNQAKAREIYACWVESSFQREEKYYAVCEKDGKVVGFYIFAIHEDRGVLELSAVDVEYQRQRIARRIVETIMSFLVERGIFKVQVGVQSSNFPIIRLYSSMGFKPICCSSVYHLWSE